MDTLKNLPSSLPELYDPSLALKVVGVARKYRRPGVVPDGVPEYTTPGGPNSYHLTEITFWTSGFFPGQLWVLAERNRLLPESVKLDEAELVELAKYWQEGIKPFAYPARDHDQGFRFMTSFGRDYALLGDEETKKVVLDAAKGLSEMFNDKVGCTRSWYATKAYWADLTAEHKDQHFLVIVDNMMNLDLLFQAAEWTGEKRYAEMAAKHAETTTRTHIREDFGTVHVVNFDQNTGEVERKFVHQGWKDESTWSRGQAWAIYGFAQCAERTGRADFLKTSCSLADRFLSLLPEDGVPYWDFDHPRPTPRDASAGTIAAGGLLKLFRLLKKSDPKRAEGYLERAFKLVRDTIALCGTPKATVAADGVVDFGEGGWETLLKHSTINGNEHARKRLMDHGLTYADYYLLEFSTEALKLKKELGL